MSTPFLKICGLVVSTKRGFQWRAKPTADGKRTQVSCWARNPPPHYQAIEMVAMLPLKCSATRAEVEFARMTRMANEYLDDV